MTNEIANVNHEVLIGEVVREEKNYVVIKNEDGKFVRKAKYNFYSSVQAETKEEKIWLMNLYEGSEDTGNGLKEHVGKIIEVANIITRPYDKINEETGATEYGVLTYLLTPDKIAYVTSSKNVYFSINNIMDLFGAPDQDGWENIQIKVLKEKGANGDMIKIKMVG
jgi:RNase P/RNase MRP subunit p29